MEDTEAQKLFEQKAIIMNGFTRQEISMIMRAVKSISTEAKGIIFATTTENSLQMPLKDLLTDLSAEHEYYKKNLPSSEPEKET